VGLLHRLAADEGRTALDASRLDLALWVLGSLADCPPGAWHTSHGGVQGLPVPDSGGVLTASKVGRCSLTPDVNGYRVRFIRIWGRIRTDIGSCSYGYRIRCGGAG